MLRRSIDKRALVRLLSLGEPLTLLLACAAFVAFLVYYLPPQTFSPDPATGGDTGSHYWPLVTLVEHAIPNWTLRTWNPGNLGGEPHLVHYFPLPYLVMAVMSIGMPLAMAFNIGTLLGTMLLPLGAIVAVLGLGQRFAPALFAALFTAFFLYNEGYAMWGGNVLSMLAGQFAHQYALFFLLCGLGALGYEVRREKRPFLSALSFAGVATSHAYVLLGVPFFALSFALWFPHGVRKARFVHVVKSGLLAFLFSAWFLVPMALNGKWNTAFPMSWNFVNIQDELFPKIFWPALALGGLSLVVLPFLATRRQLAMICQLAAIWLLPAVGYVGFYYAFPVLGLVDVRAIPQIHLFVLILCGVIYGQLFVLSGRLPIWLLAPLFISLSLWWTEQNISKAPSWLKWNYSSWSTKRLYPPLKELMSVLRGDFSQPRVIFEHADYNNATGTTRVFEMLPYFASRATNESLYLQSTILSTAMFQLQYEVSKTPSCPFPDLQCVPPDVNASRARMELLGMGDYILQSEPVVKQAEQTDWLTPRGVYGPWHLFSDKVPPALVETFQQAPQFFEGPGWRKAFYEWFKPYDGSQPFLIARAETSPKMQETLSQIFATSNWARECHPKLDVRIGGMTLTTDCPGVPHYLKFAYHDAWRTDSRDELFLVSPGFIGIVHRRARIEFTFGFTPLWRAMDLLSLVTFLSVGTLTVVGMNKRRRLRKN